MVLKYPMLILYYFRLLSCSPSSFFHSLRHPFTPSIMLEGAFPNGNQLLLRSFARMNRAATLPAVIHLLFALFIPSFTSFPASQSPRSQVARVLIRPPFFCQLIPLPSTPLKVSVYVRPSRPASVPLFLCRRRFRLLPPTVSPRRQTKAERVNSSFIGTPRNPWR